MTLPYPINLVENYFGVQLRSKLLTLAPLDYLAQTCTLLVSWPCVPSGLANGIFLHKMCYILPYSALIPIESSPLERWPSSNLCVWCFGRWFYYCVVATWKCMLLRVVKLLQGIVSFGFQCIEKNWSHQLSQARVMLINCNVEREIIVHKCR